MYAFLSLIVFISSAQAISIFSNPKKEMAAWYDLLIARETVQRTREEAIKAANDPKLKELRTEAYKISQELEKKSYEAHKFFQDGLKDLNFEIDDLRNRLKYRIADRTLATTQQKSAQKLNNLLDTIDKWTLKYSQSFTTAMREYTQANVQGKSKNFEDVNSAVQDVEKEIRKKVEEAEALVLSIKDNAEYKKSIEKWAEISKQLINARESLSEKTRTAISRFDDKATEQLDSLKKKIGPVKCKIITTIADISDRNMISCAVAKISSEQKMLDLPACKNLAVENGSKKHVISPDKPLKEYRECIGVYANKKWPYAN